MLKRSKYEVDFAEDGQKAVEMWEKGHYDLVLMDIQMPRLNGFEATRAIREKERDRGGHTPIVAMTAHAFKEDEQRCLDAGMDAYISKPIDFKKTLQVIGEVLKRWNANSKCTLSGESPQTQWQRADGIAHPLTVQWRTHVQIRY